MKAKAESVQTKVPSLLDHSVFQVGTKFFTIPWTNFLIGGGFRLGQESVLKALRVSLQRLQLSSVPLYQVQLCLGS